MYYEQFSLLEVSIQSEDILVRTPFVLTLSKWESLCMSLNDKFTHYTVLGSNMEKTRNTTKDNSKTGVGSHIGAGGSLYIGQDQDIMDGSFNSLQSLCGEVADIILFNFSIAEAEMHNFIDGRNFTNSLLKEMALFANFSVFTASEVEFVKVPKYIVFSRSKSQFFISTTQMIFSQGESLCRGLGGRIATPKSSFEIDRILDLADNLKEICVANDTNPELVATWVGVRADVDLQTWSDYITKEIIADTFFRSGEYLPIIRKRECLTMHTCRLQFTGRSGKFLPRFCYSLKRVVCELDSVQHYHLRGFDYRSPYDQFFYLDTRKQDRFVGMYKSKISKTSEHGDTQWVLSSSDPLEIEMQKTEEFPVGKHQWSDSKMLLLTACKQYQFTCDDGTCITIEEVCNAKADCPNGDDEDQCTILDIDTAGKFRNLSPPAVPPSEVLNVSLELNILRVLSVKLTDFIMNIDLQISLHWIDSRLLYKNLKTKSAQSQNVIDQKNVWVPPLRWYGDQFSNCKYEVHQNLIYVNRTSPPLFTGPEAINYSEFH